MDLLNSMDNEKQTANPKLSKLIIEKSATNTVKTYLPIICFSE